MRAAALAMRRRQREAFMALIEHDDFLQRAIAHMVNHRIQHFTDPLTSTLVLMATTPVQLVLCEAGLLLLRTTLLPVIPYALLSAHERVTIAAMIHEQSSGPGGAAAMHETIEPSGQYTLTVLPAIDAQHLHKARLLCAFAVVIFRAPRADPSINRMLGHIILQRFAAHVTTPSDVMAAAMRLLGPADMQPPPADDTDIDRESDAPMPIRP